MSTPLRVGLIGYGLAGRVFHAPLIAATPDLALAAVVTRDPARRDALAAAHPGAVVVDTPEQLWARRAELDLVVIATPNRSHAPLAHAALAAGLPVVVDKPFAATAAAARAVAVDARARGLLLTVFQNRRWDGDFLTVQQVIASGALGAVGRFESRFERWQPSPKPGWREHGDPDDAGGLLFDLGAHTIDQALQLFGPVRTVYAELDRRRAGVTVDRTALPFGSAAGRGFPAVDGTALPFGSAAGRGFPAVDDDAFVALHHASGVRSHLWMSKVAAQRGPRFRVLGDRAAFTKHGIDGQEAAMAAGGIPGAPGWGDEPAERWGLLGDDATQAIRTVPGDYLRFYAGVAHALRTGGPPPVEPDDAIAGLAIIEAARRSAEHREVIALA